MKALTHQQEQARLLINYVHPKSQHILRTDQEFVSVDAWMQELSSPSKELLVFQNGEKIKAVALLTLGQEKWANFADIRYLTVHPDCQKQGIGSKLLEEAERRAREIHRKQRIGLTTIFHPDCPQENLVSWYLKRSYEFEEELIPTDEQQQAWNPEFRKSVRIKSFGKNL